MNYDYPQRKISVIIPVYHMEQFLPVCLRSLVDQTHSNLEILVVDDGSGRDAQEICAHFGDDRIRYIKKKKNEGLFRARVTGAQSATGDYIAFVDSDDSVSVDFFRMLLCRAERANTDVAMGATVTIGENGEKTQLSMHEAMMEYDVLMHDELRKVYFEQSGCCTSWQNVWNKIYRKKLFDFCLPYFETLQRHIVMGEDIAFSSILLYNAQSLAMEPGAIYFYHRHESNSTGDAMSQSKALIANLGNMKVVFDYVDHYLEQVHADENILENFTLYRQRYGVIWRDLHNQIEPEKRDDAAFNAALTDYCGHLPDQLTGGTFFGLFRHIWGEGLETIKKAIIIGHYQYISFDVFDTLVVRPFDSPRHMFRLLDRKFESLYPTNISFHTIREDGETGARMEAAENHPEWEDITLGEIYDYIGRTYGIPEKICTEMMAEEEVQEIRHCTPRKGVRELYEVAKACGKKILLITDMYLSRDAIAAILKKNGYEGYTEIFVSSQERKLKATGHLYEEVLRKLAIDSSHLLHIGDNEHSDIQVAIANHIDAYYVPQPLVLFENKAHGYPTGSRARMTQLASGALIDFRKVMNAPGFRSMVAMAANRYYMNPFTTYEVGTNFCSNPFLLGYFAVGMHMAGVLKWLIRQIERKGSKRIFFTSRDGWLAMQGYESYRRYHPELPPSQYLYVSRKAVLPAMIRTKADFYDLPIEVDQYTPAHFLKVVQFCCRQMSDEATKNLLLLSPIPAGQVFQNIRQYHLFVCFFLKTFYSEDAHKASLAAAQQYFSCLQEGDLVYDMGYSGRIQAAINRLAGHRVDAVFIHSDPERYADITRRDGFTIDCFYDFSPMMPDLIREHMLSDCGPACIGYRMEGDHAVPVLENTIKIFEDRFVVDCVQRGAMTFLNDLYTAYEGDLGVIPFHSLEVSLPFEGFLAASTPLDRAIFRRSYFEDEVYSGKTANNIENYLGDQFEFVMPASKNMPEQIY